MYIYIRTIIDIIVVFMMMHYEIARSTTSQRIMLLQTVAAVGIPKL
jgi:hypothetical protein